MKKTKDLCDEQLIKLYAQGNNEAFNTLLLRYKNRIFNFILVSVKNEDEADDIFQETFIKIICCIKQGKYSENGKFLSWATRIAHNMIIDHFRKQKSETTFTENETDLDYYANLESLHDDSIEDYFAYEQTLNDINKIIDSLPKNQQEVVRMRFYQDLSFKEIAEKTNVGINTALGRMRYALQNIKRIATEKDIVITCNL